MSNEIKRKVELWLSGLLSAALPEMKFYASKGGDGAGGDTDAAPIVGPASVVTAEKPRKLLAEKDLWLVPVSVIYVTSIYDTTTPEHSVAVRKIYDVIAGIQPGFDGEQQLMVSGTDITEVDEFEDAEKVGHGDLIALVLGCAG